MPIGKHSRMSNTDGTKKFWSKHSISTKSKPMKKFENTPKDKTNKSDPTDNDVKNQ